MIYRAMTLHIETLTACCSPCRSVLVWNYSHLVIIFCTKKVIRNHLPQKLKTACQHFLSELYIHVHVYEMQDLKRVMYSIIEIFTCTSLKYSQTKFLLKIHIITGNYILSSHLLIIGYFKISDQFCLFFTV